MGRTMEWAARAEHLGGIPRKLIFTAVGAFARVVTSLLNSTTVHNSETLLRLLTSRPRGTPLITVSNHMSTLDDPLMWGFKGFPIGDARVVRWVLTAEDICFKNALMSYFFRLGKCIPITRGGGIYQKHMDEALDRLKEGDWPCSLLSQVLDLMSSYEKLLRQANIYFRVFKSLLSDGKNHTARSCCWFIFKHHLTSTSVLHTFPEGKVSQEDGPIRRVKWGTASLIDRSLVTPIVLPIVHHGFEKVMPEKSFFGRRPPVPLCCKNISIIVGDPIEFNLPNLRETAKAMSQEQLPHISRWPTSPHGLDEAAQRWLYTNISDKIRSVMEGLRVLGTKISKFKV